MKSKDSPRYAQLNDAGVETLNQLWEQKHPGKSVLAVATYINERPDLGKITNKTLSRVKTGKRVEPTKLAIVEKYFDHKFTDKELDLQGSAEPRSKQNEEKSENTKSQNSSSAPNASPEASSTTKANLESESLNGPTRLLSRLLTLFTTPPPSTSREKLLRRISEDIDQRIEGALNEAIRNRFIKIYPEKEDNPKAVGVEKRELAESDNITQPQISYSRVLGNLERSQRKGKTLESSQRVLAEFRSRGIPLRLLILGEPGSGKTTELLELAYDLLLEAKELENAPIPLIFELSTWKRDTSIKEWLVEQSKRIYLIPDSVCERWLEEEQIVPLLDGLDELGFPIQQECISAIDKFIKDLSYPHTVVCCRREQYEEGKLRFKRLRKGLTLQPLNDDLIQHYLEVLKRFRFWKLAKEDSDIHELIRQPLYLSLIVTVGNDEEQAVENSEDLFNAFIDNQFIKVSREGDLSVKEVPSPQKCLQFLSWLAKKIDELGEPEFLIEELQPSWLVLENQKKHLKWSSNILGLLHSVPAGATYAGIIATNLPALFCKLVGLQEDLGYQTNVFIITGIISLALVGIPYAAQRQQKCLDILTSTNPPIRLYERIVFSPRRVLTSTFNLEIIFRFVVSVLIIPLFIYGFVFQLPEIFQKAKMEFAAIFILSLLLANLPATLEQGVDYRTIEEKISPNQGIHTTLKNCLMYMMPFGVISGAVIGYYTWLHYNWVYGLVLGLLGAISIGTAFGLGNGLEAVIQHYVLRHLLQQEGSFPRDCIHFLEYAQKLRFIQKVGGRYRFLHTLLGKHFATGKLKQYSEE